MKITSMIIKLLNLISSFVETAVELYRMVRDFAVSTISEIKGHFGKDKDE